MEIQTKTLYLGKLSKDIDSDEKTEITKLFRRYGNASVEFKDDYALVTFDSLTSAVKAETCLRKSVYFRDKLITARFSTAKLSLQEIAEARLKINKVVVKSFKKVEVAKLSKASKKIKLSKTNEEKPVEKAPKATTKAIIKEYEGKAVLAIVREGKEDAFPIISFGRVKARAIIEHFEDIKKFAK